MKVNFTNIGDDELILLIAKKKKDAKPAFEEIYSRYNKAVYTYCRKIVKSQQIAEDIFQETFTRFYEYVQKKQSIHNVNGFLLKIARNLCLNENSKYGNNVTPLDENFYKWEDEDFENNDLSEILHKTIDLLPDIYKEVLILKEFMDFQYSEISESLDISITVVRMRLFRARKQLRELMQPYIDEFQKLDESN